MINEDTMRELYDNKDEYNLIAVKVSSGADIAIVQEKIKNYLRKERDVDEGEEDFVVESPKQALESLDSILFGIQVFIFMIAAISIIVGGIGIANTMYTSVIERTKEIGIMKSLGARRSQILYLFLIESGLLGLIGGILGIILGISSALGLAFIGNKFVGEGTIALTVSPLIIILSLVFSFTIGVISGVIPAIKAARLKPVEAIKAVKW